MYKIYNHENFKEIKQMCQSTKPKEIQQNKQNKHATRQAEGLDANLEKIK